MNRKSSGLMRALAVAGALVASVSCDINKVLDVQPANLIPSGEVENPANAALLVTGAASDFDCAFNSYVAVGALVTGEFVDALQTADRWPYNQRTVLPNQVRYSLNSCTALGMYAPLQGARVSANNIRRLLEDWTDVEVPGRQALIARAAVYEGWSQLLMGESFSEMVFSTVSGEEISWGTVITRAQALDSAITRLTQAIDVAQTVGGAPMDSVRYFALVGRARAQQDKAYIVSGTNPDLTVARADAVVVPANFVWNVTGSGTVGRRNNRVFQESNPTVTQQSSSVGTYYRTIGQQPSSPTGDPRVLVQNMNRNSSGTNVPQWAQRKYSAVNTPIPAATGAEMQLLIAEADAPTAQRATSTLPIIAAFRLAGNQPAYTGTTPAQDRAEIQDQRRRALWLTGVNMGDVIRYNIDVAGTPQLSPPSGSTTPWGQQYGPSQGASLLLPLPDVEKQNNPLLH